MFGRSIPLGFAGGGERPPEVLTDTFTTSDNLYVVGDTITFTKPADTGTINSSNGIYAFPIRNGTQFKITLYGAAGGAMNNATNRYGGNSNGGIISATMDLSAYVNTNLYIVRGGGGQNSQTGIDGSSGRPYSGGRFNGGGQGAGTRGPSGGGRTDLRTSNPGTNPASGYSSELLVAGGGGGEYGDQGTSGGRYYGQNGGSGYEGDYAKDNGGGGGGYYGGNASNGDDNSRGGPGSNFYNASKTITLHTNTTRNTSSGGNNGHGYFGIEVIAV